jgi:hypothetical protein
MKRSSRPGFSIFDLLVIIAILAVVIGLLARATLQIRESANRLKSQNNLKQWGIAVHNHHDVYGHLPAGTDKNGFSACSRMLPFVEQENLFKAINFDMPTTDKANAKARATRLALCISPDDPLQAEGAPTNYLYSAGSKPSLADNDGVFYLDSKVRITDVLDGTSNTLMIGETLRGEAKKESGSASRQHVLLKEADLKGIKDDAGVQDFKDGKNIATDRGASWIEGAFLQGTFTGTRGANDKRPDVNCGGAGGLSGLRSVTDTVTIALCDGSVRTVKTSVKADVWKFLSTRNGGEDVPDY